jgi:hypothetical protein
MGLPLSNVSGDGDVAVQHRRVVESLTTFEEALERNDFGR